jgi:peroxiredoxin
MPMGRGSIGLLHFSQMISLNNCAILVIYLDCAYIMGRMCSIEQLSLVDKVSERKRI